MGKGVGVPALGESVRMIRFSRGIEQDELARRTGITQSHLSKIENGKAHPSLKTLKKLAQVLGVDQRIFFPGVIDPVSMVEDNALLQHLDYKLREFVIKEDNTPYLEFARSIHEVGFTLEEMDALKLIFFSRRK